MGIVRPVGQLVDSLTLDSVKDISVNLLSLRKVVETVIHEKIREQLNCGNQHGTNPPSFHLPTTDDEDACVGEEVHSSSG